MNNPKDAGLSSTVTFILCVAYLMGPKKGKRLMKKSHGRRVHSDLEGLDLAAHLLGVLRMFGGGVVQGGAASFNFKEDAINLKQVAIPACNFQCFLAYSGACALAVHSFAASPSSAMNSYVTPVSNASNKDVLQSVLQQCNGM